MALYETLSARHHHAVRSFYLGIDYPVFAPRDLDDPPLIHSSYSLSLDEHTSTNLVAVASLAVSPSVRNHLPDTSSSRQELRFQTTYPAGTISTRVSHVFADNMLVARITSPFEDGFVMSAGWSRADIPMPPRLRAVYPDSEWLTQWYCDEFVSTQSNEPRPYVLPFAQKEIAMMDVTFDYVYNSPRYMGLDRQLLSGS